MLNITELETERLVLRKFTYRDIPALFHILHDEEVNRFLPWYPVQTLKEAKLFYEEKYASEYSNCQSYAYAICLKDDTSPVGCMKVDVTEPYDFGYYLKRDLWNRGIATEAGLAVVGKVKKDGLPYLTATHDRNNPASGRVMRNVGMEYQYSYMEKWQPKNILVTFRMYQINLDGDKSRIYKKYWDGSAVHFIEPDL